MRNNIKVREKFPKKLKFGLYMAAAITGVLIFNMIVLAWRL